MSDKLFSLSPGFDKLKLVGHQTFSSCQSILYGLENSWQKIATGPFLLGGTKQFGLSPHPRAVSAALRGLSRSANSKMRLVRYDKVRIVVGRRKVCARSWRAGSVGPRCGDHPDRLQGWQ